MDRVDYESIVIQDVSNYFKNEELKLDPWYQRRSVWNVAQKAYLLNTLFVKKPIPTIYIRHYLDIDTEKSIKEVVDGQQRLRAILGYLEDDFSARHPAHPKPVKYSELSKSEKTSLKMTKLSTGVLVEASDGDVIEIFGRLNSISKTLNSQEKRNAKFSGVIKQFCLENAARQVDFWRESNVFSATDISRMDEVQFVSDVVLNLTNGLSDFSAQKLDKFYEEYDDEFPDEQPMQARLDHVFDLMRSIDISAIRDTIFSRSPIFFSLFLALDNKKNIKPKTLENSMRKIDALFNDEGAQRDADREFKEACTASTQRIKSRQIRAKYISNNIA